MNIFFGDTEDIKKQLLRGGGLDIDFSNSDDVCIINVLRTIYFDTEIVLHKKKKADRKIKRNSRNQRIEKYESIERKGNNLILTVQQE